MLVAFSVTPIGAGEDVGELVAEAVRVVRASGLPNRTDAIVKIACTRGARRRSPTATNNPGQLVNNRQPIPG